MTDLKIKERRAGDVTVLDLDGDLRMDGGSDIFRTTMSHLLKQGQQKILLNLAGVAYVDSSGLGELISSHVTLNDNNGQLKLLHLTQRVRELMKITKLLTIFDIYESKSEALNSFNYPAPRPEEHRPVPVKEASHETHS
ncbi:MAG TPA: STAS domain-containing protein [Pyrinomonadaceae bacterium]